MAASNSAAIAPGANSGYAALDSSYSQGALGASDTGLSAQAQGYQALDESAQQGAQSVKDLDPWQSIKNTAKSIYSEAKGPYQIASGLYQMYNGEQMKGLAKSQIDPNTKQYQQQLAALQANPSSITSMPGYQFQLDQGKQALGRKLAAGGYGPSSGNYGTAMTQYGQDYASNFLNTQEAQLQKLAQGTPGALQYASQGNALLGGGLGSIGAGLFG
jgi:hypothetical protein